MMVVVVTLALALLAVAALVPTGCRNDAATSSASTASTASTLTTDPTLATAPASVFTDVPDNHRYARAINELARLGIVSGRGDDTFGPDEPVYRAQFAKMICGLLGLGVSEEQSFAPFTDLGPDDPDNLYPHEFVGAAYQARITKGKTATAFSPYADISLPQVITMVIRAADASHPGLLATPPRDWYACWADSDPVHGANVRRAGYTDLLALLPIQYRWTDVSRPATRGEVAQILFNLHSKLNPAPVSLTFEGERLDLAHPIQVKTNRYYLPLHEFLQSLGGALDVTAEAIHLRAPTLDLTLDPSTGSYTRNQATSHFAHRPLVLVDTAYVSLFDLQQMLNLKVVWDESNGIIHLFWNRDNVVESRQSQTGKTALLRFEDITADQKYATAESLERLRVVFDHCYSKGIPMHLAWVPRYIDPEKGIDNAPADDHSMHNANFVYTLDYFAARNGVIGLHGYTHQYGNQVSLRSAEFDAKHNTSESSLRKRLQYALDDAEKLGITVSFFESPHYAATYDQKIVMAQIFDIIYELKWSETETVISRVSAGGRRITFVPTPLGYIEDPAADTVKMVARISALGADRLGSFFHHPYIEARFMTVKMGDGGYPLYEYAADSPLHRVIDAFMEEGYTFRQVSDL